MVLVACHLYPRSGTIPTEDFGDKVHGCGLIKLYVLLVYVAKSENQSAVQDLHLPGCEYAILASP